MTESTERIYCLRDEQNRVRYVGRTSLKLPHRKRLHQNHLQSDPLSSPLYRHMHTHRLSFDLWTIHELATVAFPQTNAGCQLETAAIQHFRQMPEGVHLLNSNLSHHEYDDRRRRRSEYQREWRLRHGQGTANSYMAAASRRHRARRMEEAEGATDETEDQ